MNTPDRGGVVRYIRSLLEAVRDLGAPHQFTVYFNLARGEHLPAMREFWRGLALPGNFTARVSRVPYRAREYLRLPVEVTAGPFDVFHGCFDQLPIARGRRIVTLHDVRYLEDLPEPEAPAWLEQLRRVDPSGALERDFRNREALFSKLRDTVQATLARADKVLTISEFSRSRLVALAGADPAKVHVVHHGVGLPGTGPAERGDSGVHQRLRLQPGQYVLSVGKFDPLKNQLLLVRAIARLRDSLRTMLVLVGPFNWYYHIVRAEVRALGIEDRVVFTDYVADRELVDLYRGATLCAIPSVYEGFCLPVLEAMSYGVPVLANAVCSIPEVAGDAAHYVAADAEEWASALAILMADADLRAHLGVAGRSRARQFTWEATARHTIAQYESLS